MNQVDPSFLIAISFGLGLVYIIDVFGFEIIQLIFEPGFSSKEEVTKISGRGVGMDVVKKNIESFLLKLC